MDARELLVRGGSRRDRGAGVRDAGRDERVAHRLRARGSLGVPRRCAMIDEHLVEDVAEHLASTLTAWC